MRDRCALILGVSGQDGSYMAELLLTKGYQVVGTSRSPQPAEKRLSRLGLEGVRIVESDLSESSSLEGLLEQVQPSEIYNFAAFSTGSGMFEDPISMGELNGLTVVRILEAIRKLGSRARLCQASSSEMFRGTNVSPQNEATPLVPMSPYGAAKAYAHHSLGVSRRQHGIFACSAILYNHESPRRPVSFVTRKVTRAAAEIKLGFRKTLELGDVSSRRDWSHARDIVRGMWLMLQQTVPQDFVLATGRTHSVAELCEIAFSHVGLHWEDHVTVSPGFLRPDDQAPLVGDCRHAQAELGWTPNISFEDMIIEMVEADLSDLKQERMDGDSCK